MKKKSVSFIFCFLMFSIFADKELSPQAFLARSRRPNSVDTFAMLSGRLQHRRGSAAPENMTIYFGVIIQKDRSTGQLILGDKEGYLLGQAKQKGGSSVIPMQKSTVMIDRSGVRASDLTLDFLYYDFFREDPEQTLGGFITCRVMVLRSPDKKEEVRVFLSKAYYFPLRAEFFRPGEKEPWRVLETGGFTKKNDLYYIRRLRLEGPGWRTRIEFEQAELGIFKAESAPKNLIRKISAK